MSGAVIIVAERCHWCSRQLPPRDQLHLSTGQRMCERCHEWHGHALKLLSEGVIPPGCQQCGLSMEVLNKISFGPTTRMYVVVKDGCYQVLCWNCKEAYVLKRSDLYLQKP